MEWSFIDSNTGKNLEPRKLFGKSQLDICKEIMKLVDDNDFVFLKANAGFGKSGVALNVGKEYEGRFGMIEPTKNLQKQMVEDYSGDNPKIIVNKNDRILKLMEYKGRNNFQCLKYKNICAYCRKPLTECTCGKKIKVTASDPYIDCTKKLENGESRKSVASECKFWSPVVPRDEEKPMSYISCRECLDFPTVGSTWEFYKQENICPFYKQFDDILNSDGVIVNNKKFILEFMMGRMPSFDILFIDEVDKFFDDLRSENKITFKEIRRLISKHHLDDYDDHEGVQSFVNDFNEYERKIKQIDIRKFYGKAFSSDDKIGIDIKTFFKILTHKSIISIEGFEDLYGLSQYYLDILDDIRFTVKPIKNEYGEIEDYHFSFVIFKIERMMSNIIKAYPRIVGMSATIQSENILKNLFGIKKFKTIEVGTGMYYKNLKILATNKEFPANNNGIKNNADEYFKNFNTVIKHASKNGKTLVGVVAYKDFPDDNDYEHLPTTRELNTKREEDNGGMLEQFKKTKHPENPILFSSKDRRGTDLPEDMCRHVVLQKMPYENVFSTYWLALKEFNQGMFWTYYKDQAKREVTQQIARGLRSETDYLTVYSPDSRVLELIKKIKTEMRSNDEN